MSKSEIFSGGTKVMGLKILTTVTGLVVGFFTRTFIINFFDEKDKKNIKQNRDRESIESRLNSFYQEEKEKIRSSLNLSEDSLDEISKDRQAQNELGLVLERRRLQEMSGIGASPYKQFSITEEIDLIGGILKKLNPNLEIAEEKDKKSIGRDISACKSLMSMADHLREYPNGYKPLEGKTLSNGNEITIFTACLAGGAALGWFIGKKMISGGIAK